MDNFKIYNEGKYDIAKNLKMKINNKLPVIIRNIDNFFVNH